MARKTEISLRASSAQTSAGTETGGAQSVGKSLKSGKSFKQLTAYLDVTAVATDTGDKLDVYVDASPDGGTTWFNVMHFTQILGDAAAQAQIMTINGIAAAAEVAVTSDAASGAIRDVGFFDTIRYRGTLIDTGGNASFTWALHAFVK